MGVAIDIYILVLPIVAVNKLQMPTRRKVGIMLIFMTGLLYVDILFLWFTCSSDTRLTTLVRVWDRSSGLARENRGRFMGYHERKHINVSVFLSSLDSLIPKA